MYLKKVVDDIRSVKEPYHIHTRFIGREETVRKESHRDFYHVGSEHYDGGYCRVEDETPYYFDNLEDPVEGGA